MDALALEVPASVGLCNDVQISNLAHLTIGGRVGVDRLVVSSWPGTTCIFRVVTQELLLAWTCVPASTYAA